MPQAETIRFADLAPSWHVKRAKEPGYLRWLVSWVGGPEGYVNANPGVAACCHAYALGFMHMPAGNRQAGLHTHSVAEIYVILQGELESIDGAGNRHSAGPLDCLYIPAGVPHGVRTVGTTDLRLVWLHDQIERNGVSVYVEDGTPMTAGGSVEPIKLIRFRDLEPAWTGVRATEVGHLHWCVDWVGPLAGRSDRNAGPAANPFVSLGLNVVLPGNTLIVPQGPGPASHLVLHGDVVAQSEARAEHLHLLDALHCSGPGLTTLRNVTTEAAQVLTVAALGHE